MHYVYVIKSKRHGLFYTGYTNDLRRRLDEHNSGGSFATKPYAPWELEVYVAFKMEVLAKNFERYLKSGSGIAFRNKRLVLAPGSLNLEE